MERRLQLLSPWHTLPGTAGKSAHFFVSYGGNKPGKPVTEKLSTSITPATVCQKVITPLPFHSNKHLCVYVRNKRDTVILTASEG